VDGAIFEDRAAAGRALAELLRLHRGRDDVVVLALPRGGVPVAAEVARSLDAPLGVVVVRKLGVPGHEELAMGAIASGDEVVLLDGLIDRLGITNDAIDQVARAERAELARREAVFRGNRPMPPVEGKVVLLVDDGIATGATMRAAVLAVRRRGPARVVVAVPVAAASTCEELTEVADDVICVATPDPFVAVGQAYRRFDQLTDDEVREVLAANPDPDPDPEPEPEL